MDDDRSSGEDGLSEAAAEASIAEIVEAERARQAEELVVAEAEAAAEREEPDEPTELGDPEEPDDSGRPARRLAVLGSPVAHSKSPLLHRAAYAVLGLDWEYTSADVSADGLAAFLDGLGPEWRGLSLTMPLKQSVIPLADEVDRLAEQTGAANTVLLDGGTLRAFNTDVSGLVRAVSAAGVDGVRYVHVLGGGATAASALAAAAELGAERVDIFVRSLERSVWLERLAHQLGLMVRIRPLGQADRSLDVPQLVISTLPGGAATEAHYTDSTRRRALLFDVSYDPWPSVLGQAWNAVGGRVVSGLALLAHQALLQVRIFVSGDPLQPLEGEDAVFAEMLDAVGIDQAGAPLDDDGTATEG
jgi:shikimate dehydrogenase